MSIFKDLVADLEKCGSILSKEQIEANVARNSRRERLDRNRIQSAITEDDYRAIIAGTLAETPALLVTKRWVHASLEEKPHVDPDKRPPRFLMLIGQRGLGKTVAAAWAIAEAGGFYLSGPSLAELAESSFWRDADMRDNILGARLVVLDDLGTEDPSTKVQQYVGRLINERQGRRMMTMLTGNISEADMEARYGDRAAERIWHQGAVFDVAGQTMRRSAKRIGRQKPVLKGL